MYPALPCTYSTSLIRSAVRCGAPRGSSRRQRCDVTASWKGQGTGQEVRLHGPAAPARGLVRAEQQYTLVIKAPNPIVWRRRSPGTGGGAATSPPPTASAARKGGGAADPECARHSFGSLEQLDMDMRFRPLLTPSFRKKNKEDRFLSLSIGMKLFVQKLVPHYDTDSIRGFIISVFLC